MKTETDRYGDIFCHFRYTSSKDGKFVYAFLLIWPKDSNEITLGAPLSSPTTIVTLLGSSGGPLSWQVASGTRGIVIDVSNIQLHALQSRWTWAFKLENLLPNEIIIPTPGRGACASIRPSFLFSVLVFLFYLCTRVI
jgi:hypothetical protein